MREEVNMKLLQPYLAEPTDMSHLRVQGPPSPHPTHTHTLTHKHKHTDDTDICPQLQQLITNSSVSVWVCVSLFCVCSSFHLYLGRVEIIDDTLISYNLLLMLLACDCHHQTRCTWLLLEQSGSVCSVQARDTHIKKRFR